VYETPAHARSPSVGHGRPNGYMPGGQVFGTFPTNSRELLPPKFAELPFQRFGWIGARGQGHRRPRPLRMPYLLVLRDGCRHLPTTKMPLTTIFSQLKIALAGSTTSRSPARVSVAYEVVCGHPHRIVAGAAVGVVGILVPVEVGLLRLPSNPQGCPTGSVTMNVAP